MKYNGILACVVVAWFAGPANAQFVKDDPNGPQVGQTAVQQIRIGMTIKATGGPCFGVLGTVPVPMDWPEQRVRIVEEDITPGVKTMYRMVGGTAKQLVVNVPRIRANEEARAIITFEVTRSTLTPPEDTAGFEIPTSRQLERDQRIFLGQSPYIESRHRTITSNAREIVGQQETAWDKVEALYDWSRDKVSYQEGSLKGALKALQDGTGDCEDISSLFIALCRAEDIPARTVWVHGHCYPEFLLVDAEGEGHWFPCQAAGTRSFGGIPEQRPILQKGDNFRTLERPKEVLRYVSPFLTVKAVDGVSAPSYRFIRESVGPGS